MSILTQDDVHKKVADAVVNLTYNLGEKPMIMPVNRKGIIANHLVEYAQHKNCIPGGSNSLKAIEVNRYPRKSDIEQIKNVLTFASIKRKPLYALVFKAKKENSLDVLRKIAHKSVVELNLDLRSAALFDPKRLADYRGSEEDFSELEEYCLGLSNRLGAVTMNLSENTLESNKHIQEIKRLL